MVVVIIVVVVIWVWEIGKVCLLNGGFFIWYFIKRFLFVVVSDRNLNLLLVKVVIFLVFLVMLCLFLLMSGFGGV